MMRCFMMFDGEEKREGEGKKTRQNYYTRLITNRRDFSVSLWSNENITQNTITEVLNFH